MSHNTPAAPAANGIQAAIVLHRLLKAHPEPESQWPPWMQDLHLTSPVQCRNYVSTYHPVTRTWTEGPA